MPRPKRPLPLASSLRAVGATSFAVCLVAAAPLDAWAAGRGTDSEAARADAAHAPPERKPPGQHALSVAAAVVPGAVVHGTGHWARGDAEIAQRLVLLEALGLGMFLTGGATIVLTGASRYLVAPAAALTMAGFGLFTVTWFADIYGTAANGRPTGESPSEAWAFESSLGHLYVADPNFAYSSFMVESLTARHGTFRLTPSAWLALDDQNARYRLTTAYRPVGALPDQPSSDGSFAEVEIGATFHDYGPNGFNITTFELSAHSRLDLVRWGSTLRGAFADLSVGYGLEVYDYDVPGASFGTDLEHLLLGGFGFGLYLLDPDEIGGHARVYYDHRHDGFAAGLKMPGLGSGVVGHFGADLEFFFSKALGVALMSEVGSAWLLETRLLFREADWP